MDELTPHQVGRVSEQRVASVLEFLKDQDIIRGYRKTKHQSTADRRGVDFYIFTTHKRIPLQVKSSFHGKANHDHYQRRVHVPCVVGRWPWGKLVDKIAHIIEIHGGAEYGDSTG